MKKKAHVFIISDFLDQEFESQLRRVSKKHDTVAVVLEDKLELDVPSMGLVDFEDPETGEVVCVDTSSPVFRKVYRSYIAGLLDRWKVDLRRVTGDRQRIR